MPDRIRKLRKRKQIGGIYGKRNEPVNVWIVDLLAEWVHGLREGYIGVFEGLFDLEGTVRAAADIVRRVQRVFDAKQRGPIAVRHVAQNL